MTKTEKGLQEVDLELARLYEIEAAYQKLRAHHAAVEREVLELRAVVETNPLKAAAAKGGGMDEQMQMRFLPEGVPGDAMGTSECAKRKSCR